MVLMVVLSSLLGDARDAMSLTSNDLDARMAVALHFLAPCYHSGGEECKEHEYLSTCAASMRCFAGLV